MVESRDRASRWVGKLLKGKWRIEAKIGQGGVASVFRATGRQGELVALKLMHPEYSRHEDVRRRFLREGYVANKVGHPAAVRALDADVAEDGSAYLVMELLHDGETLEDRREKLGGRLPVAEVVHVADQILDMLGAAHARGIVHRDIKPENIYLMRDGTVKVLDFGIAHIREAAAQHEPTATGLVLGTPEYMSPEQALGTRGQIDAQTDLYALGATMFTLISGEAVHVRDSLAALLVAVSSRQARSLASVRTVDVPSEIVQVVDQALHLDKHRRWPSARAMQEALRRAAASLPAPLRPPRSEPPESAEHVPASAATLVKARPQPPSVPPISGETLTKPLPAVRESTTFPVDEPVDSEDVTQAWQPAPAPAPAHAAAHAQPRDAALRPSFTPPPPPAAPSPPHLAAPPHPPVSQPILQPPPPHHPPIWMQTPSLGRPAPGLPSAERRVLPFVVLGFLVLVMVASAIGSCLMLRAQ
jgi:serine/threonine-protein kinase